MGVDGNAQPGPELAEVGVCHNVREHPSPLMDLQHFAHNFIHNAFQGVSTAILQSLEGPFLFL